MPSACNGYDAYGSCEGNTLNWCNDWGDPPEVVTEDCNAAHEVCAVDADGWAFCINPPECGAIDWTGTCEGNTVKYCNDFAEPPKVESLDCVSPQVCGLDPQSSIYTCVDAM